MRKRSNKDLCPSYPGRQWKQMFTFKGNKFDMMLCIAFLVVVAIACTSERLEGVYENALANPYAAFETNRAGPPVAEHFTSASHSLDDIMVCGLKQSGSNISRKQHEMKLIFKLGTPRANGLNIKFNFL